MRDVPEWQGKDDNAMPPTSVFRRLLSGQEFRCPLCTRALVPGNITRDHIKPLCLGGQNRETNLQLICTNPCSLAKSSIETSDKSQADRWMNMKFGIHKMREKTKWKWQSKWKRKVNGRVVLRDE